MLLINIWSTSSAPQKKPEDAEVKVNLWDGIFFRVNISGPPIESRFQRSRNGGDFSQHSYIFWL